MVKMLTQWDTCLKMAVCLVQLVYLLFIFMMVKHLRLFRLLFQSKSVSLLKKDCTSAIEVNFIALGLHFLCIVNKYIELWL